MNTAGRYHFETPENNGILIYFLTVFLVLISFFTLMGTGLFYRISLQSSFGFFLFFSLCSTYLYMYGYFEKGIEMDFQTNTYRKYFSRGIFRKGKWKIIPDADYILIRKNTRMRINHWRTHTGFGRNIGIFNLPENFYYETDLITKGDIDLHFYTATGFDEAVSIAKPVSLLKGIQLFERTLQGDIAIT